MRFLFVPIILGDVGPRGVCGGGRDGAGVCLLFVVVNAISGRAVALAAEPLH